VNGSPRLKEVRGEGAEPADTGGWGGSKHILRLFESRSRLAESRRASSGVVV
jgi:hypothetical protein